jgi:hypothetical protein
MRAILLVAVLTVSACQRPPDPRFAAMTACEYAALFYSPGALVGGKECFANTTAALWLPPETGR